MEQKYSIGFGGAYWLNIRFEDFIASTGYTAGEQGWWFDSSDRSTLFRDSAGKLPVTESGQTVGLHLDKSKGLVLGAEFITNNGDFSDGLKGLKDEL